MKKYLFLVSVLMMGIITGCISTPVPPVDARITLAPDIGRTLNVTSVRCIKNESGYCTFQANVANVTNSQLRLEYKVQWLDGDGIEIDSVTSSWQIMAVQPMEIKGLRVTAASMEAADFRLYVRKFRR